ncbi:MAG: hypothetical protein GF401_20270 [Chitinivibrionales bacterium]|nr:hypothetical protein [Chitinivibrionales bacterium]
MNGREICSRTRTQQDGKGMVMLDAGGRNGIFLLRASIDGITMPAEKVVLK